ncbi:uncharacterized protein LOC108468288 [Gossypium arboreum]|uniref:uncharacterized protein LOC108468288 n=1 Tax=Gossypium arboreum TaxID=29729 RepID=UPI0008196D4C|nr:uncharacterized protein LOC108468288 [Gossypium arboreum]
MVRTRNRAAAEPSSTVNPHRRRFSALQAIDLTNASSSSSSPPHISSPSLPYDSSSTAPSSPPPTSAEPFSRSLSLSHAIMPPDEANSSSLHNPSDAAFLSPLRTECPLLYLLPPETAPELMRRQLRRRATRPSAQPTASNTGPSSNTTTDANERPMPPDPPQCRPRFQPQCQSPQPSEALTSSSHNSDTSISD